MSLNNPEIYINRLKDKFPNHTARSSHPVHIAFELINLDVIENQVPWNKCMDCGQPYVIGEGDSNSTFCSEKCEEATRTYLGF